MEPSSSTPEESFLEALRRRRAELRESMTALEVALAGPPSRGQVRWAERVHVALVELSGDFREHLAVTEGPDGLYPEVIATAPRLSEAVARLTQEHARIRDLVEELLGEVGRPEGGAADVHRVRELGTALLGILVRHRQRGSDLVYEAFEFDVGGET